MQEAVRALLRTQLRKDAAGRRAVRIPQLTNSMQDKTLHILIDKIIVCDFLRLSPTSYCSSVSAQTTCAREIHRNIILLHGNSDVDFALVLGLFLELSPSPSAPVHLLLVSHRLHLLLLFLNLLPKSYRHCC